MHLLLQSYELFLEQTIKFTDYFWNFSDESAKLFRLGKKKKTNFFVLRSTFRNFGYAELP